MKIRHIAVFVVLASWLAASAVATADDGVKDPQKLIATLNSNAPAAEKAITCKRLAIYGGKEAIPALAPLLADEHLSSWARIALEAIPGPEADEALRQALDKVQGRPLVGLINSIGVRACDAKAVEPLAAKLKDANVEVASAAAVALGRIGNDAATQALENALSSVAPAARSAVAQGCVLCAEKRLAEGKNDAAIAIYDLVRGKSDLPKQRIREATRGAILARNAAGVPLMIELLHSDDKQMFNLGLTVARELSGRETTDALVAEFGKATPERQSLLILAIADRGDAAGLPTMLQAAKSGSDSVKLTIVKLLRQHGNASCVPLLLDFAVGAQSELADAAVDSLAGLPGKDVDADIVARLPNAAGKTRFVLLQLAGDRVLTAAVPEAIKAASDTDLQIRLQALRTLGAAVTFKDLSVLVDRVAGAPENAGEAKTAFFALKTACTRMADIEGASAKLAAAMPSAKVPAKIQLLEVLTAVGGKKALETVAAAATDSNADIQDAGTRLLGKWMTLDAAPVLVKLLSATKDPKQETRLVRAYIRMSRQFPMSNEERVKMCRTAIRIAKNDPEKKLILTVLGRYASPESLQMTAELAKQDSLKADAGKAVFMIVQKIGSNSPQAQQVLAQMGMQQVKIEIVKAEYGAGNNKKDVTGQVREGLRGIPIILLKNSNYNEVFGGDPAPGTAKQLTIEYRFNGKDGKATFPENATIFLPKP